MAQIPRRIKVPGQRLRHLVQALLEKHPIHGTSTDAPVPPAQAAPPIRIVCVSDTHNQQPNLPSGDVLIHAGDLTENGGFEEFQTQLSWISAQPHRHKILIAGNHDVLLDELFLKKYPERRYGQTKTAADLDWGSIQYLEDFSVTLTFSTSSPAGDSEQVREIRIFGSPWTPKYGVSAFQYPRDDDIWSNRIPDGTDIVVAHGPPRLYLDKSGVHQAGCVYLAQEISRVKPRLVVSGHIHVSYGREDVVLDRARRWHDDILNHWGSYVTLALLTASVIVAKIHVLIFGLEKTLHSKRFTTFVNAAVVGGAKNELKNEPIVVEI